MARIEINIDGEIAWNKLQNNLTKAGLVQDKDYEVYNPFTHPFERKVCIDYDGCEKLFAVIDDVVVAKDSEAGMSMLDEVAEKLGEGKYYITEEQVKDIISVFFGEDFRKIDLVGGILLHIDRDSCKIRAAMESVVPEKLIFDFFPDENDMDAGNFHHYRGKVAGYNQAINNMKANIKKYLEGGGDTDG